MSHFELPASQPRADITEQLDMQPGERISSVMLRAKALQREMGRAVQFSFNMQVVTINPETKADEGMSSSDTALRSGEDT